MSILASASQSSNPVVKCVRRAKIDFSSDIGVFDFVPNAQLHIPVLFLSFKFHLAFKQYLGHRVAALPPVSGQGPIVLLLMDAETDDEALERVTSVCVLHSVRLLLAWSPEEAAMILEILHLFGPDRAGEIARGQFTTVTSESQWAALAREAIGFLQVGPKDANNLLAHFGSLKKLILASESELAAVPQIGVKKSKYIFNQLT